MDTQIFIIIFIGFSLLVIMVFGLDIYYLTKKTKEELEEKGAESLQFSERFMPQLEKTINEETKKNISEINQKISQEVITAYQKKINLFSEKAEQKLIELENLSKKEISKITEHSSRAEALIFEESKKMINKLSEGFEEKIGQIYQTATKSISEKMIATEKNIEKYRDEKIREIDQKIYQIIENVAKQTLGKAIDISTHEELVVKILERAKKEIF